ncbi:YDG/SRA domain-containing protein, partial [Helicosporidium sp. ATCC 50920]
MSGKWQALVAEETEDKEEANEDDSKLKDMLQCTICHELCVRPVTAPCQHNFCLKCFQSLVNRGGKSCPTCRQEFGAKFAANPRINTALTVAIRSFKAGASSAAAKACERINDSDRPDEAFTTDRAVRAGRANAASGRIMVTVPNDHFGPIPPEADPRGQGIRVGEWWKDRLDCRQWGAHFPHVAGIAGQSNVGAQSVVLSGGYEDDMDEGEWFLYTGSGGRDLSGNKRTNKFQSHDQKFDSMNQALRLSCERGLPVRVVRSFKEKRSSYAPSPDTPVRYDGVYRIVACWRKPGAQGFLMCRYLFVRADSEP